MTSLSEAISNYYYQIKYEDIPSEKIRAVKYLTLDYLGVASKGASTPSGRIAIEYVLKLGSKPLATIIGSNHKAAPMLAAFANSISSHSIELDDVDDLALYHHSPPILSTAFAAGEKKNLSGKSFLKAVYCGCEMMARLSNTMNPSLRNRGFHTTPVCGVFGAAITAALILGLTPEKIVSALGLAGAQSSGLMEMYGESLQKRFNTGPAARDGIVSAEMAAMGYTGTHEILEGKRGFFKAFSDHYDENRCVEKLGEIFPVNIEFKRYACARPIHNGIDCALNIQRKHSVKLNDIRKITVYRHPDWANYHLNYSPKNINEAQVSMPYSVAIAFKEGDAFWEQFDEKFLNDDAVNKALKKISIEADPKLPRGVSCLMVVETHKEEVYKTQVDYPKGSKENPMTEDELIDKFKKLANGLIPEAEMEAVIENVFSLEKSNRIEDLTQYFRKHLKNQ